MVVDYKADDVSDRETRLEAYRRQGVADRRLVEQSIARHVDRVDFASAVLGVVRSA